MPVREITAPTEISTGDEKQASAIGGIGKWNGGFGQSRVGAESLGWEGRQRNQPTAPLHRVVLGHIDTEDFSFVHVCDTARIRITTTEYLSDFERADVFHLEPKEVKMILAL
jgi:hypothetical protein